jgi:folate-dependent phosphoribosylglycinamide formyltransferase PurN
MSTPTPIGLFTTFTGPSSRDGILAIVDAVRAGRAGNVAIAFIAVNRVAGESADTDASVDLLAARFPDVPIVRTSAVRHAPAQRKAARAAEAAGDPAPLMAWRDAYYTAHRERLPATALDFLLGDMWIWGPRECAERRGVNLHPALPWGPLGKMWFDVIWDLVERGPGTAEASAESGAMLHRVIVEVDEGPVVSYCRYAIASPDLMPLWAALPGGDGDPAARAERAAYIAGERAKKRETGDALFWAIRRRGVMREVPLMLETMRVVGEGWGVAPQVDRGVDLTAVVDAVVGDG